MSSRLRHFGAAVLCVSMALAAAAPGPALAQRDKPSADELWETYPLHPTVSPTPARPEAPATERSEAPAAERKPTGAVGVPAAQPDDGGGGGRTLLIVVLAVLAAVAAFAVRLRTRRPEPAPAAAAPSHPARPHGRSLWWRPAAGEASRGAGERPARGRRPHAGTSPARFGATERQPPPWPHGTEDRWRCEITLGAEPLSSRVQAVAYPPGRDHGVPIATSSASPSAPAAVGDWQSPEGLERAVRTLATALQAEGWEPVGQGAGWYARRFSWPGEEPPPRQVNPVTAGSGGAEP